VATSAVARAISGIRIRHAPQGADLLGRATPPADGRWQRGAVVSALYLADSAQTATAEWDRSLAERGFSPQEYELFEHHRWRLKLELADLSTRERLEEIGLGEPRPNRRTWPAFQRVGEQLWHEARTLRQGRGDPICLGDVEEHSEASYDSTRGEVTNLTPAASLPATVIRKRWRVLDKLEAQPLDEEVDRCVVVIDDQRDELDMHMDKFGGTPAASPATGKSQRRRVPQGDRPAKRSASFRTVSSADLVCFSRAP